MTTIWLTYEFDNEAMHHWWMPDGYDVCIFGTNNQGQDMFSKVLYGSRVSLKIGFTVALLTVTIGTIVGSVSGYFGGRIDEVIMRICDIFFAVPGLILAMAFVTAMSAMTSLTMPVWLGVLVPILVLWWATRSYLESTVVIDEKAMDMVVSPLVKYRGLLIGTLALLFFLGALPGMHGPSSSASPRAGHGGYSQQ